METSDLATGLGLIGFGSVVWRRRAGWLLIVAGCAWLLGDVAEWAVFAHRGVLFFVVLSYPTVRPRTWREWVVPLAVGGCTLIYPLTRLDPAAVAQAATVVAGAGWRLRTTAAAERGGRVAALVAAVALASVVAAGGIMRLTWAGAVTDGSVLRAYELVVLLVAAGFCADLRWGGSARAALTNLVVDLGEGGEGGSLRARLAVAIGDPLLAVAYWLPDQRRYVDEAGQPVDLARVGEGRVVTPVEYGGERFGALVHDAAVFQDRSLVRDITSVARLAVVNVRLQAEVRARLAELEDSRRRIVEAAEVERRRLERELDEGARRRLDRVAELLAGSGPEVDPVLRSLHAADVELREFARGIRPPVLVAQGLAGALDELAQRCPLPVDLDVPQVRLDPARESAAYFICSEAIANAVKHARASRLAVRVTAAGGVVVEVEDDGVGGADATRGSGLRGLAERAEAFGGRLRVDSDPGQGTRLTAWLAPGANG